MRKDKKKEYRLSHRILVLIKDISKQITINEDGKKVVPVKWEEVKEANLGSLKHPNKDILGIRLEPIRYESENEGKDIFGGFFK